MMKLTRLMAAAALALSAPLASAVLIDFNSVPAAGGNGTVFGTFTTDGFTFSSSHGHQMTSPSSCSGSCADNGTQYVGGDMVDFSMSMGGGTFSVGTFDLAEAFENIAIPTTLTLTATFLGGGTATQTISFDGIFDGTGPLGDFQSVTVNLTNLIQLDWAANGFFSLDNINTEPGAAPVPEPASLLLAALGLLGLGARRLRS